MNDLEIRRRLRAARMLAAPTESELEARTTGVDASRGITVEELTARIQDEWPTSSKTIGAIERGERQVRTMELRTIAAACGLPYEFFTADLPTVLAGAPAAVNGVAAQLEAVLSRLEPLAGLDEDEARSLQRRARSGRKSAGAKRAGRSR